MKPLYSYERWKRPLLLLLLLLLGAVGRSQAQVYYLTTDGALTGSASDALNRMNYDGSGMTAIIPSVTPSPLLLALDLAGNRAFVYEGVAANRSIKVFTNLSGTPTLSYTLPVPAQVSALEYDAASDYLYFLTTDAVAATTSANDALYRTKPDGSAGGNQLLLSAFTTSPLYLALNIAANRAYVYEGLAASRGIKTIDLSTNTVVGGTIAVPAQVVALNYARSNGYLYYLTTDGVGNTGTPAATDAIYRTLPDGNGTNTTSTAVVTDVTNAPAYMALDLGNNRIYVVDNFNSATLNINTRGFRVVSTTADGATGTVTQTIPQGTQMTAVEIGQAAAPTVTTNAPTSVTSSSAILGGSVPADGGATVTGRGVVYSSTNSTPAIGNSGVTQAANGSGTGTFSATISGLTPGTTYYVRAYATNSAGTSYGGVQTFTTPTTPTVTTAAATNVASTSATLGGNVIADGGATVTGRGVVYSLTSANASPTIGGTGVTQDANGSGTGTYSKLIAGLSASTSYTVRAYAINSLGPSYGSPVTFTTAAPLSTTGTQTNVSCNGATNGAAMVAVSGGLAPYTYSWSPSVSPTATASNLSAGAYTVTVTDAGGATTSRTFTITQPAALTATTSQTNVTTNGGSNGSATITVSGGTPGYTYSWSPSVSTTATASNLSAGTYTVTATDALGCTIARTFTITQPAAVTTAPTVTAPANGSLLATRTPTYSGTAPAGSTVTVYVDNASIGTTTAPGGSFSLAQPTALVDGAHSVYATAQLSGQTVSANSNTNAFTVDVTAPTATLSTTSGSPTSTAPIPFAVSFSETVAGFSASGISVSNGTVTGSAVSGSGPYTFTVTPTTSGTVTVSIQANAARDAAGNGNTASNSVSVQFQAPTITVAPTTLPNGTTGVAYSQTFTASGGTAPYSYAITAGALPSGLTLASSGTLSGTPTASGSFTFTVRATDASVAPGPYSGSRSYTLTINGPTITVAPATLPNGTVVTAYSQTFTASGGTAPYSYAITAGALPAGLTLASNGVLSGTPTVGGSFSFTVTATDASGPYSGSRSYSLTIAAPTITVAPATLPNGTVGVAYSQTITASGGTAPYTYAITAGAVPTGLSLTTGGVLSGTPSGNGSFTFTVTATDNSAAPGPYSGSRSYTVTVGRPAITVAPATLPNGTVGVAYSQALTASGGSGTYTYAITGTLPTGLSLSGSTISGTPTASGSFSFSVTATDGFNSTGSQAYTVVIAAPTITVAPATLPGGTQGTAYSVTFSATGGTAPYSYAITAGALPSGLTLSTGGIISGTPTTNGSFSFTVTALDASSFAGSRTYTLSIAAPAVTAVSWTGTNSTNWFDATNWNPNQVPNATIDAVIPTSPSGGRFPTISSNASAAAARNVSIAFGASLAMSSNTLTIAGNLTNNGAFNGYTGSGSTATGGTVVLGSTALSSTLGFGSTRFWNLTVATNGAQLSTAAGATVQRVLTLTGSFATNGNPFALLSDADGTALVVNNGGVVSGNVTVQRFISPSQNAGLGYRHYTAPISNATVASLATGSYTPVVNPAYNTSAQPGAVQPFPNIFGYDQGRLATTSNNLNAFNKGYYSPTSTSDALGVGRGYTVNLSANQTLAPTGPLNNGDISLALSRNSDATAPDAGWQLVGNPYPAPLDYAQVAPADRSNLDAAIYVYQSTGQYVGQYRTILGNIGGNTVLAQGQAFFARVSSGQTSGTLTFRNSQRVATYQNPAYARPAETRPLVELRLQAASGSALADVATVYFEQGAGPGVEPAYDAVKLTNPTGLNLSTAAAGQQLAIDGQAPLGSTLRVVPLTVGVPAPGNYTLSASQLLNLSTVPVYLRDLLSGAVVDLAQQSNYAFTVSNAAALVQGRFELVFSPQQALATVPAALAQQVGLYPNPAHHQVTLELPLGLSRQPVTATLVDALGRVVRQQVLPASLALHQLPLQDVATGVYSLRLTTELGVIVRKLVVE